MKNCDTLYPIMLVHGMGFRDSKRIGYWGRIPNVLRKYGAQVYHGNQDANGSVESNAETLRKSLQRILSETGAKKVNIIAHSKGGIEARYLISSLGEGAKIASLTCISTPHNGSETVEKLMKLPKPLAKVAMKPIDLLMKLMGDKKPDTYTACQQLTTSFAQSFNEANPDDNNVYYQSFGFVMKNAFSDVLMMIPYIVIKFSEGKSDGLLTEKAVKCTNFRGIYTGAGIRGISHCDEVDLRRRPLSRKKSDDRYKISDITKFYTDIVSELRDMGF